MLPDMFPRQYSDQGQSYNQRQQHFQQAYGATYMSQAHNQPSEYIPSTSNLSQPQKQSSVPNQNYVSLRPATSNNLPRSRNSLNLSSSLLASQYGASIQNAQQQSPVPPLHWPERANSQQIRNSQPLVQQTLSHLGIPNMTPGSQHIQNMNLNAGTLRHINRNQATPSRPISNQNTSNQAMNLSNPALSRQHSTGMMDVLSSSRTNNNVARTSNQHRTNSTLLHANNMLGSVGIQAGNYVRQISEPSRDKISMNFANKRPTPPTIRPNTTPSPAARKRSTSNISDASSNKDDAPAKTKPKLELDDATRIVIDDDLEIVGCKQAEIMSHSRSDCPIHPFLRVDSVTQQAVASNIKSCEKCFCYICDIKATQCKKWTDEGCAHCNAHSKASCWKARRNMKKSPLMALLSTEDITPSITEAGEKAVRYIIKVREFYITYRAGISCDFHQVPCDCNCHRDNKLKPESCVSCKAVHDLKKRFNYDPVRQIIYSLLEEIRASYEDPYAALVLYEALLSELCTHRPADFNHVTRVPSNPDINCQCTTPQIMDDRIEPALLRLFTLHEISKTVKEKFLTCINNSIQPLQLKDVMKKFLTLRHWDDLLLRAVLSGQNTSGRAKANDVLKESPLLIEMRVQKLDRERRYHAIVRYLKAVKVLKQPKQYEANAFSFTMEKWLLLYSAKMGCFRDVCIKLISSTATLKNLPVDFMLELLNALSGQGLDPETPMANSFCPNGSGRKPYTVSGADHTALVLLFIIYLDVNVNASVDLQCHLWFARWVNQRSAPNNPSMVNPWIRDATNLVLKVSQQLMAIGDQFRREQLVHCCKAFDHQVPLFVSSLLVLRFVTKINSNMGHVEEFIKAYENNDWVLFHLFGQNAMLTSGNRHVIDWLVRYMEENRFNVAQFNLDTLSLFIQKSETGDIFLFLRPLLSSDWTQQAPQARHLAVKVAAKFAFRLFNEPKSPRRSEAAKFLYDIVLGQILLNQLHLNDEVSQFCEVVAKCCCLCHSISCLENYKKLFHPAQWQAKCLEVFNFYDQQLARNSLNPDETVEMLHWSVKEGFQASVRSIFARLTDKHECSSPTGSKVMQEVINILDADDRFLMNKSNLMAYYTKLCSHETLSWLICAVCSAKMPDGWMKVWVALDRNNMGELLRILVQHTLQLFTTWMKELAVQEESDIQRLLRCLDVFTRNVVKTLLECKFARRELESMLLETRFFIADARLRKEYMKIVQNSFPPEPSPPAPKPPTPEPKPQQQKPANPPAREVASSANQIIPKLQKSPVAASNSRPTALDTPERASSPPLSETSPQGNSRSSGSEMTSPRVCPRCGDPMTSSFKCSRCQGRQNRDVTCPSCGQVNLDLKGYSCRFCYASLLTVLTGGEVPRAEKPPVTSSNETKKKKKKKRKKLERQLAKDAAGENRSKDPGSSAATSSSSHTSPGSDKWEGNKIILQKTKSTPDKEPTLKIKRTQSAKEGHAENSEQHTKPNLKIKINSKQRNPERQRHESHEKKAQIASPKPQRHPGHHHHHSVVNRRPAENLSDSDSSDFEDPKTFHDNNRTLNRKWSHEVKRIREFERTPTKARNHSDNGGIANLKSPPRLHKPPHVEVARPADPKIPPIILKRKSEDQGTANHHHHHGHMRSPEHKKAKIETGKRTVNKGLSMSKKQRDILQRMKGFKQGKKASIKSTSSGSASSTITPSAPSKSPVKCSDSWDLTRRRKPGPASRTSYYVINPRWRIPRHIKVPYTLDLPKICSVHLSPFPPNIMHLIHEHQPNLRLTSLYA